MKNTQVVKLSATEELILGMLLSRNEPLYGLQIVQDSEGQIARGSVYVTLDRMQEKGLVESKQENKAPGVSGIPRRLYKPTGHGMRVYRAWVARRGRIIGMPAPSFG